MYFYIFYLSFILNYIKSEKKTGIVTLNFELMSSNLYELISKDNQNIPENTVKQYMYQVLVALEYIHGYLLNCS